MGKSSVINTLKKKKVCKVAPIPGETKVWQYIMLMKSIYLIDCPGTVQPSGNSDADAVLKGVVRIEQLRQAQDFIEPLLARVKKEYIQRTYGVLEWSSADDFLEQYGRKIGKLRTGGEPDTNAAAKHVLHDFQRGRLPYFCLPPGYVADNPNHGVGGDGVTQAKLRRQSMKGLVPTHKFDPEDGAAAGGDESEGSGEESDEGEEEEDDEEGEEEVDSGVISQSEGEEEGGEEGEEEDDDEDEDEDEDEGEEEEEEDDDDDDDDDEEDDDEDEQKEEVPAKGKASRARKAGAVSWEDVFAE